MSTTTNGFLIFSFAGGVGLEDYELTNCSKVCCGESNPERVALRKILILTVNEIVPSVGLLKSETGYAFI